MLAGYALQTIVMLEFFTDDQQTMFPCSMVRNEGLDDGPTFNRQCLSLGMLSCWLSIVETRGRSMFFAACDPMPLEAAAALDIGVHRPPSGAVT